MKCEECEKQGLKSKVYVRSGAETCMGYQKYWDDGGKWHIHDPNVTHWHCSCSNGHEWTKHDDHPCWCGWPKKKETA